MCHAVQTSFGRFWSKPCAEYAPTSLTNTMTHSWCSSEGVSQGNPSLGPTRFEQQKQRTTHTVRKRFIVWHTVRIDSSCAHVSTCGPHSKLCATKRGPPCKQGATNTTLHEKDRNMSETCQNNNLLYSTSVFPCSPN